MNRSYRVAARALLQTGIVAGTAARTGCIPIPHRETETVAVTGQLLAAGIPLANRRVSVEQPDYIGPGQPAACSGVAPVVTNQEGYFATPRRRRWRFWASLIGGSKHTLWALAGVILAVPAYAQKSAPRAMTFAEAHVPAPAYQPNEARSYAKRGVVIGAITGTVLGAAISGVAVAGSGQGCATTCARNDEAKWVVAGAVAGAILGGASGYMIGSRIRVSPGALALLW